MEKQTIRIAVACHKPSRLPKNDLFMPVQVNSCRARNRMNMAHDDEGENISVKNPEYCELTAQYWEWKNVEADYYGLCHYRRFFCFTVPERTRQNERKQIEAEAIDDWNIERYGLEDEETMRNVIESCDVVTGMEQDVSRLYSPRGNQKTALKHWVAHDRALIMIEDLYKMLDILTDVSPELGRDAREYLEGSTFTGFNCFVMKRDLFREMCRIEFETLERLEKETDISHYCTQLSRIYGFMGEIISSAYIYHLKKKGCKIQHIPLVYFNYTDEEKPIKPLEDDSIPVVFYHSQDRSELFTATWQSFLSNVNADRKYDTMICNLGSDKNLEKMLSEMTRDYPQVSVRFIDQNLLRSKVRERCFVRNIIGKMNGQDVPALPFLLEMLTEYENAVVIGDHTLINKPLDSLWNEKIEADKVIAAPLDLYMLARINDIFPETEYLYQKESVQDPWHYYATTAFKVNLKKYRASITEEQILNSCLNQKGFYRNDTDILNVLFQGRIQSVDLRWCVWFESNPYLEYQLPYAPRDVYQELLKARQDPYVITFMENDPYENPMTPLGLLFWKEARKLPCYEAFVAQITRTQINAEHRPRQVTKKLFRKGTSIHAVVSRVIPKGSKRYNIIKKTLNRFHME